MKDENEDFKNAIKDANPPVFPNLDDVHESLRAKAKANIAHTPRQQGPWLVCVSCQNRHTIAWIGVDKKLVGLDENGGPILENRF